MNDADDGLSCRRCSPFRGRRCYSASAGPRPTATPRPASCPVRRLGGRVYVVTALLLAMVDRDDGGMSGRARPDHGHHRPPAGLHAGTTGWISERTR